MEERGGTGGMGSNSRGGERDGSGSAKRSRTEVGGGKEGLGVCGEGGGGVVRSRLCMRRYSHHPTLFLSYSPL